MTPSVSGLLDRLNANPDPADPWTGVLFGLDLTVGDGSRPPWGMTLTPVGAQELQHRLTALVNLADALEAEAAEWFTSGYLHERGEASGRATAALRIRRILSGGNGDEV